jgi:hypothetical protein
MSHRRVHRLALGLAVSAIALVLACAEVPGEGAVPAADLPTMSVELDTGVEVLPTAIDLIRESYVVARGRFVGGPSVVQTSPDGEEMAHSLVVWEFLPDEVYRDVRTDDAPSRVAEERRGSILVPDSANEVGRVPSCPTTCPGKRSTPSATRQSPAAEVKAELGARPATSASGQRSRSSRRRILPVTVFGSSSRRTTERGYL